MKETPKSLETKELNRNEETGSNLVSLSKNRRFKTKWGIAYTGFIGTVMMR